MDGVARASRADLHGAVTEFAADEAMHTLVQQMAFNRVGGHHLGALLASYLKAQQALAHYQTNISIITQNI